MTISGNKGKKILLLTEGDLEKKVLRALFKAMTDDTVEVVRFKTDIYQLIQLYEEQNLDYENIDVQVIFKERSNLSSEEQAVLEDKYTDILLVFDFDPHSPQANFEGLEKFLKHFQDSTDMGKLYINYPMMESYKHIHQSSLISKVDDEEFIKKEFTKQDLQKSGNKARYKKLLNGREFLVGPGKLELKDWRYVIGQHLKKLMYILGEESTFNFDHEHYVNLFQKQKESYSRKGSAYVLNTSILIAPELYPKKMDEEKTNDKHSPLD